MRSVTVISGGMDSAALLWRDIAHPKIEVVEAVSFDYGQRHNRELKAAEALAAEAGVPWTLVQLDLGNVFAGAGSSQVNKGVAVPEGHYADENMKKTVVPNRNMLMLSIAASRAISIGADRVSYGAHAGDHAIYPDCRTDFIHAMQASFKLCDWNPISLAAPFHDMTKADIAKLGDELGVPFGLTWTCYKGGAKHCGKCGACVERREAFKEAGVKDPTKWA